MSSRRFREINNHGEQFGISMLDVGKGNFSTDDGSSWSPFTNNTATVVGEELVITYVDDPQGASIGFNGGSDLSDNLVVGQTYRMECMCKVNTGSSVDVRVFEGVGVWTDETVTSETLTLVTIDFVAAHVSGGGMWQQNMGAGEIFYISYWTLRVLELNEIEEIINVSAQSGSIIDRWGNTLTNTAVTVFKFS